MMTIINEAANMYSLFTVNNELSKDKIKNCINLDDKVKDRVNIVISFYKLLMDTDIISDVTKIFITCNAKYDVVARIFNNKFSKEIEKGTRKKKTEANVKADIYYANKKLRNMFVYTNESGETIDLFHSTLVGNISAVDLKVFKQKIDECSSVYETRESKGEIRKILVNIPKVSLVTSLSKEDYDRFMELIGPYFPVNRSEVQKRVNNFKKEAGYVRYLLNTDQGLSELDLQRKDQILGLIDLDSDKKTVKLYDEELAKIQEKLDRAKEYIENYNKEIDKLQLDIREQYAILGEAITKKVISGNNVGENVINVGVQRITAKIREIEGNIQNRRDAIALQENVVTSCLNEKESRIKSVIKKREDAEIKKLRAEYVVNGQQENDLIAFRNNTTFIINDEIISDSLLSADDEEIQL